MTEDQIVFDNEVDNLQQYRMGKESKILILDNDPEENIADALSHSPDYIITKNNNLKGIKSIIKDSEFDFVIANINLLYQENNIDWIKNAKEKNATVFIVKDSTSDDEFCKKLLILGIDDFIQTPVCNTLMNQRIVIHNKLKGKRSTILNLRKGLENLEEENSNKLIEMYNDLQLAYKELELRKKELESLDKAKSDFIKIVSHEIRTPLSGILGFSQLLKSKLPNEYNNYIGSLNQSALRLQEFSNKAILISKLKTTSYQINREPVSILFIVNSIIEKYEPFIKEKQLKLRNNITHRIINADFGLCEKSFIHVIDNAIRYAPEGSTVFFEELYTNDKLTIMIIDQGPGFSEEVFSNIFGLFAHGEQYIDKNVGLGLYMVKLIMNYLGGSVKVANNKDGGALVKLIFPV